MAAADVVYRTRLTVIHNEPVGSNHVTYVGEITARIQITNVHNRILFTRLNGSNLAGKCRGNKALILPRTNLIERPHSNSSDIVA